MSDSPPWQPSGRTILRAALAVVAVAVVAAACGSGGSETESTPTIAVIATRHPAVVLSVLTM